MKAWLVVAGILLSKGVEGQTIITTFAGGGSNNSYSGLATAASIYDPTGIAFDANGSFYFAETAGNRICKVDNTGMLSIIAGNGTPGYNGDGIPATSAQIKNPQAVVFDKHGNLYFPEAGNNRIRKIDAITGIITTVAGTGVAGYNGDNILATSAQIRQPEDICFDNDGNFYIADDGNYRVRRVDTNGIITTYAGDGTLGSGGDNGVAILAQFTQITGLAFDHFGNLFIADWNGGRIRKVDVNGIITTFAGTGILTYNGDNISATSANIGPIKITFNRHDELFLADPSAYRIRKIDMSGVIHTVAGNGICCYSGDNGPADSAQLGGLGGVAIDSCGNVYLSQVNNPRIRKVTFNPNCWPESVKEVNNESSINIYPNPAKEQLNIECSSGIKELRVMNTIGQVLIEQKNYTEKAIVNVSGLNSGVYFIQMSDKDGRVVTRRFVKE